MRAARAATRALLAVWCSGWIVAESDQSPHPAASRVLAGYLVQRELRPLVETETVGPVELAVPRDRDGSFQPQIVENRLRRLTGVEDMVISLSAKV